ncbi:rod shape-determining protein MreD [Clostridium sp. Sa3CUN1]|uniref:Rod shape-determining protein MreD n=1 Tax=Clostridium gallinarum TaxID=2762246 RepID=A0ABR8Q2V7_9CLOT|nr:rod shape-determining protein MreD [Clostridium gallinarum]MBD7914761.1 rod shape-determining protein MreD [Clostridium gallinarum]
MKKWVLILISVVLLILDNSLMPFLAIRGAFPSLLFTFAIACSIVSGRKEAVTIGVISGLLQDIYFYEGFGINSLTNMLICLLAAIIGENIYREKKLIPVISMFFLYVLKVISIYLILKIANKTINIHIGIYASLYSTLIMFFGYNFVLRLYDKKYKNRSWRFK